MRLFQNSHLFDISFLNINQFKQSIEYIAHVLVLIDQWCVDGGVPAGVCVRTRTVAGQQRGVCAAHSAPVQVAPARGECPQGHLRPVSVVCGLLRAGHRLRPHRHSACNHHFPG